MGPLHCRHVVVLAVSYLPRAAKVSPATLLFPVPGVIPRAGSYPSRESQELAQVGVWPWPCSGQPGPSSVISWVSYLWAFLNKHWFADEFPEGPSLVVELIIIKVPLQRCNWGLGCRNGSVFLVSFLVETAVWTGVLVSGVSFHLTFSLIYTDNNAYAKISPPHWTYVIISLFFSF